MKKNNDKRPSMSMAVRRMAPETAFPGLGPKATIMLQPSSFAMAGEGLDVLIRDYTGALVSDLGWMTRRQVKSKDTVDLRPLLSPPANGWEAANPRTNADDIAYGIAEYWHCYVPCFEEGVLHVNSGRYIYWKLEDLDFGKHRMAVWLHDFAYYDNGAGWHPGVNGLVCWKFEDPEETLASRVVAKPPVKFAAVPEQSVVDYVQLYGLIGASRFDWTKAQRKLWEEVVLANARESCAGMKAKTGMHNLDNLAGMFTSYMLKVNRILDENREAVKSRPVSDEEHKAYAERKKAAKAAGTKPLPERRVMNIGGLAVTARSKPKSGRRAAASYTKASWVTRGHMRTLKSGKKVWIRQSVHRRKALMTPENAGAAPEAPRPVTIRVHPDRERK